jgi:hypothetical protein
MRVFKYSLRFPSVDCQHHPQAIPTGLDIVEAQADLVTLDKLRPRLHRLRDLLSRGDDADRALGSDIYSFSLDAYASLKIAGKGAGLETLRQAMSNRSAKEKIQATQSSS